MIRYEYKVIILLPDNERICLDCGESRENGVVVYKDIARKLRNFEPVTACIGGYISNIVVRDEGEVSSIFLTNRDTRSAKVCFKEMKM